jgi:hypothetical protein
MLDIGHAECHGELAFDQFATRAKVHISVASPLAIAPSSSSFERRFKSFAASAARRPSGLRRQACASSASMRADAGRAPRATLALSPENLAEDLRPASSRAEATPRPTCFSTALELFGYIESRMRCTDYMPHSITFFVKELSRIVNWSCIRAGLAGVGVVRPA